MMEPHYRDSRPLSGSNAFEYDKFPLLISNDTKKGSRELAPTASPPWSALKRSPGSDNEYFGVSLQSLQVSLQ
jgi:hypothetical protein